MKLQTKFLLALLPPVLICLILLDTWASRQATQGIHDSAATYLRGVLFTFVDQNLTKRHQILLANQLCDVPSFVQAYQQEAAESAKTIHLLWPGHIFAFDARHKLVFDSQNQGPAKLEASWAPVLEHLPDMQSEITIGHHQMEMYAAALFEPWDWRVFVSIGDEPVHRAENQIRVSTILFSLICAVLIILILNLVFRKFVIRPIQVLKSATAAIASREHIPFVEVTGNHELSLLARDIEKMAHNIHAYQLDLEKLNQDLESQVAARTRELDQKNQELGRSNRELEDFAYIASHDLNEPLRKISAFGDLLAEEEQAALSETGKDYIRRMQQAAQRMGCFIEDLLAYSRVTTQAKAPASVDLNDIVRDVSLDLDKRLQDTAGTVTCDDLPTIEAEPLQMRQLFQNLIGNSLKYITPGVAPLVSVKGRKIDERMVEITFTDNGIGFDEKCADRIFQPFQRLHGKGVYEGSGIGLAICRKIVIHHSGTITATSKPDQGACFIVTLPLAQHSKGEDPWNSPIENPSSS